MRGQKEVEGVSPTDCWSMLVGWEVAGVSVKWFGEVSGGDVDRGSSLGNKGDCLEMEILEVPHVEGASGSVWLGLKEVSAAVFLQVAAARRPSAAVA